MTARSAEEGMNTPDATEKERSAIPGRKTGTLANVSPGDTLAGRFLLRGILGYGATGTVFSALDRSVGQKVAIKVLHPDLHDERTRERLRREVRASRNGHPNLVAVYDLHEADGRVFLSMELVEGRSLKELFGERKTIETSEVVVIGRQVAAALAHLHGLGIIHRDVKPGNILLAADGVVKLCDMGLARPIEEGMTVTETEMVVGTPAYMAPEQGLGADLTGASDIYALGLTLYQCLTGKVPLTSETAVATLTRRQRERPPALHRERPDCPRWLNRLIRRMLEPRPQDRLRAAQVARVLDTGRLWPTPRRRVACLGAIVLVLAVTGLLIGSRFVKAETVRVGSDGTTVFGLDRKGRTTWTHLVSDPPAAIERCDLNADGRDETVITGRPIPDGEARSTTPNDSYVLALSDKGDVVTRISPRELIGTWQFPYRIDVLPIPSFDDVDADGWSEILVNCRHNGFYPAALLIYWPRWNVWDCVLHHPGSLITVSGAAESGRPGVRFVAYNNLLGMIKTYGEIDLVPPPDRPEPYGKTTRLLSPPGVVSRFATVGSWRTYVPFAEGSATPFRDDRFEIQLEPELIIGLEDRGPTLDAYYNPINGPNKGLDLRDRRMAFALSLAGLGNGNRTITASGTENVIESIRNDAGPLMSEGLYDVILSTLGAKALARAGDLGSAVAMLEATSRRRHDDDLLYRLANLYALDGNIDAARSTIYEAIKSGSSARSWFDVPMLYLLVSIAQRDSDGATTAFDYLTNRSAGTSTRPELRNNLEARARLWWGRSTVSDGQIRSVDLDADGDAIACLTRWRRANLEGDEVGKMRSSIALNPDSFNLGTVALGAVLVANGRPEAALTELDLVISILSPTSKWDYADAQVLELARAMRAVALEAAGDRDGASREAGALAPRLDPNLLPGTLVREVLQRTKS